MQNLLHRQPHLLSGEIPGIFLSLNPAFFNEFFHKAFFVPKP